MKVQSTYLGYPITVTDNGFLVDTSGIKVRFGSMSVVRQYVRELRKLDRQEAAA